MSNEGRVFIAGVLSILFGGLCVLFAVWSAQEATEKTGWLEGMRNTPVVSVARLDHPPGSQVAVEGRAIGTWPTEQGGEPIGVPVLYCEIHRHEEHCEEDDPRPDRECSKKWFRADGNKPPEVVLQDALPAPGQETYASSVRVDLSRAWLPGLERLAEGENWYVLCLRADRPLTVFGTLAEGAIRAGSPFVAAALPRDELIALAEREGPQAAHRNIWIYSGIALLLVGLGITLIVWVLRQ